MNAADRNEKTSLFFTEGSADKEYHAQLECTDVGCVVKYQYGRRGSTLTAGIKTDSPLPYDKAKKVYDALVKSKTSKGYSPSADGVAFQDTNAGVVSGLLPQLLNPVEEIKVDSLISDPNWMMQEKMDGKRIMASVLNGIVTANNRKGLVVSLPLVVATELAELGNAIVDGELVGNVYYLFDCLSVDNKDLCQHGAILRYQALQTLVDFKPFTSLKIVLCATEKDTKQRIFTRVLTDNGEGVVFKKMDEPYLIGRPNSGGTQLKYKFVESASFVVGATHPNKRSVSLDLFDGFAFSFVGNVTIPPNHPMPKIGDVVDVKYLYAFNGGSIFQPVFLRERDDIDAFACLKSQLKLKPEVKAA